MDERPRPDIRAVVRPAAGALVAGVVVAVAGCGAAASPDPAATSPGPAATVTGEVFVSAAASLADAFAEIEVAFEHRHPDVDVVRNLAGSATLREQVLEGAPTDVVALANAQTMAALEDAGLTDGPAVTFATNTVTIAVPAANPGGVTGLADFARDDLLIGLCIEGVPCGDLARQVLDAAGVVARIDTNEPDVRALLARIAADEVDAGITYVTDVASADGAVVGIEIPSADAIVADLPIATLADAPNPAGAEAFKAFVLGEDGQAIMARHGFGAP